MFSATLPFLLRCIVTTLVVYVIASLTVEALPTRLYGIIVYLVGSVVVLPTFDVMGEWGPAHLGRSIGIWALPLFGVTLVAKSLLMNHRAMRRQAAEFAAVDNCQTEVAPAAPPEASGPGMV